MNANKLMPKEYIGGKDVHDADGEPISLNVTIKDLIQVEVGQDKEQRWALTFTGTERKLTLNKTNIDKLIKLFGAETEAWKGKPIALTGATTTYGGEERQAVRIAKANPSGKSMEAAAEEAFDPESIPF